MRCRFVHNAPTAGDGDPVATRWSDYTIGIVTGGSCSGGSGSAWPRRHPPPPSPTEGTVRANSPPLRPVCWEIFRVCVCVCVTNNTEPQEVSCGVPPLHRVTTPPDPSNRLHMSHVVAPRTDSGYGGSQRRKDSGDGADTGVPRGQVLRGPVHLRLGPSRGGCSRPSVRLWAWPTGCWRRLLPLPAGR